MHLLKSFFSVPVGPYSKNRRLVAFVGDISAEGLRPVVEI